MQVQRLTHLLVLLSVPAFMLIVPGCSQSKGGMGESSMAGGEYTLTFQGDASFQKPHGGMAVHAALVNEKTGKVVAEENGTISRTANPSFSFTFAHDLKPETDYDVRYWIDSNFGGGKVGMCDDKSHDHQWNVKLGEPYGDMTHVEKHDPSKMSSVCDTFKMM